MKQAYQYSIAECDVADKTALHNFRQKRSEWSAWLQDDDHHAIWNTLTNMAWTDIAFGALAKVAIADNDGPLNNTLLGEALINGHAVTQILALRRLMDKSSGTISLPRLLNDVKKNLGLITRENFVCFDGLPYDYAAVQSAALADWPQGRLVVWGDTTGPKAHGISALYHEQFDRLCGIAPGDRRRDDRLPKRLVTRLEQWLAESGAAELANWSHAFLAHAGNADKRATVAIGQVTNNRVTEAGKALARVTEALSGELLYLGGRRGGFVPVAQFDVFEKLDGPVIQATDRASLDSEWNRLSDEWENNFLGVREALTAYCG